MKVEHYDALYHILFDLKKKRDNIQKKIDENATKIREEEYYIERFCGGEKDELKIFSPHERRTNKEEIEKSKLRITELQEKIEKLNQEKEEFTDTIEKLDKILQSEEKEDNENNEDNEDRNRNEDSDAAKTTESGVEPQESNLQNNLEKNLAILKIQEDDRQRIARDLHDTALQNLAHLIHKIELSMMFIEQDPIRAKLELSVVKKDLKSTIDSIRDTVFDLRPMTFDDLGFKFAIESLFQTINKNSEFRITLQMDDISCENSFVLVTVYRIIQECVFNIAKHAKANQIMFQCHKQEKGLLIEIEDNGIGFSEEEVKEKQDKHFGLLVMRERVRLLGGVIDIHSEKEKGTRIKVEIPF